MIQPHCPSSHSRHRRIGCQLVRGKHSLHPGAEISHGKGSRLLGQGDKEETVSIQADRGQTHQRAFAKLLAHQQIAAKRDSLTGNHRFDGVQFLAKPRGNPRGSMGARSSHLVPALPRGSLRIPR
jgi:hypothetical protein